MPATGAAKAGPVSGTPYKVDDTARAQSVPTRVSTGDVYKRLPRPVKAALVRGSVALSMQLSRIAPRVALATYWSWQSVRDLYEATKGIQADLWVANDWLMLPMAARLAAERGGSFVYDTHEFAVNEYMERWKWRLFNRPLVRAIESIYIQQARVVSTVSEGIADGLAQVYGLPERPLVIRNTPLFQQVTTHPMGETIRVLYHGIVAPVRGLEPLIRSVKYWRPEFDLTIRGPGHDEYILGLHRLIAQEGVTERVHIVPAIPMTALVQQAAAFDVGFFCMPRLSKQHEYVLPNKLFEYIMAGLAVCVSDLPEMSRVVRVTGVGVLLPGADEVDIAKVVNGLTREGIRAYKARSLEVARELCWEKESRAMLKAYAGAIGRA
ncbi:MAG: glycosyltransferase [Burkholderiales bacterium]|nr:glycosyltransferase [Burkholderiales bacterium]